MISFSFDDNTKVLESIKELGLNKIRCNLTGQVIATLSDDSMERAIAYERYSNFDLSDEALVDSMQLRWLVQCSRPAPHLTSHHTSHAMLFLRHHYAKDLFAILASRLLFEHLALQREVDTSERLNQKMQWLCEFWDATESMTERHIEILEIMVRLDGIHNIRHCLYNADVKNQADLLRENEYDLESFYNFVLNVEDAGFDNLKRRKKAPEGNSLAYSAMLSGAGMTPEQIVAMEREEVAKYEKIEARRRAIASISAMNQARNGKVTIKRSGVKIAVALEDVAPVLPRQMVNAYESVVDLKAAAEHRKTAKPGKQPGDSRAKKIAKARFADLDIDMNF